MSWNYIPGRLLLPEFNVAQVVGYGEQNAKSYRCHDKVQAEKLYRQDFPEFHGTLSITLKNQGLNLTSFFDENND